MIPPYVAGLTVHFIPHLLYLPGIREGEKKRRGRLTEEKGKVSSAAGNGMLAPASSSFLLLHHLFLLCLLLSSHISLLPFFFTLYLPVIFSLSSPLPLTQLPPSVLSKSVLVESSD